MKQSNNWKQTSVAEVFITTKRHKHCDFLFNRAAGKAKPAVTFDGAAVDRTNHMRHLEINFYTLFSYRQHVEITTVKCRKVCQS